jgi:hypothetical protein
MTFSFTSAHALQMSSTAFGFLTVLLTTATNRGNIRLQIASEAPKTHSSDSCKSSVKFTGMTHGVISHAAASCFIS